MLLIFCYGDDDGDDDDESSHREDIPLLLEQKPNYCFLFAAVGYLNRQQSV